MSRFFRGGNDSTSESSSDEEELYSDQEEGEGDREGEDDSDAAEDSDEEAKSDASGEDGAGTKKKVGADAFLIDSLSESEESDEEGTTKVKSAKDKRFDELDAIITAITNGKKINDWGSISTGLESLPSPYSECRQPKLTKGQSLIDSTARLRN